MKALDIDELRWEMMRGRPRASQYLQDSWVGWVPVGTWLSGFSVACTCRHPGAMETRCMTGVHGPFFLFCLSARNRDK